MSLTLRPTGLSSSVDKHLKDYTPFCATGRCTASAKSG